MKSDNNSRPHVMDDSGIDRSSDHEEDFNTIDETVGVGDDYEEDEEYYEEYRHPPPNKRGRGGGMYR